MDCVAVCWQVFSSTVVCVAVRQQVVSYWLCGCSGTAGLQLLAVYLKWDRRSSVVSYVAVGRQVFTEFLRLEYSEENMLFWIACEELKHEQVPDRIEDRARTIYEDYISILSPKEVRLQTLILCSVLYGFGLSMVVVVASFRTVWVTKTIAVRFFASGSSKEPLPLLRSPFTTCPGRSGLQAYSL